MYTFIYWIPEFFKKIDEVFCVINIYKLFANKYNFHFGFYIDI